MTLGAVSHNTPTIITAGQVFHVRIACEDPHDLDWVSCPRVVVSAGCLKVLCLILSWKGNWVKVFKIVQMNLKLSFKRQHSRLGVGGPTRRAAASPVLPPPWFFWEKLSKPGEVILLLLHFLFSPFFNAMSLQIDFQKSAQNHQIVTHTAVHTVPWYLNKKKQVLNVSFFDGEGKWISSFVYSWWIVLSVQWKGREQRGKNTKTVCTLDNRTRDVH